VCLMIYHKASPYGRVWRPGVFGLFLGFLVACAGSETLAPSTESPQAGAPAPVDSSGGVDSSAAPGDSIIPDVGTAPGIVFASFDLPNTLLGSVHTGALRTPDENTILDQLAAARAKGARFVLKLAGGSDGWVKNADGTFNFEKWKSMVSRYKDLDISSFIADGTILGHYLLDEPNLASRWGGKVIPQATVEAMAHYSKQLWPGMLTFVRVVPSWLIAAPVTYTYLDAGWAQYAAYKGDAATWLTGEVAAAKAKGLGLVVSLNVLNGGNGSSGIRGPGSGKYSMSAAELRSYGGALLDETYTCGLLMWMYEPAYFGRTDIQAAMADVSAKARSHGKTSCQQ
jgi:hypothetical protein